MADSREQDKTPSSAPDTNAGAQQKNAADEKHVPTAREPGAAVNLDMTAAHLTAIVASDKIAASSPPGTSTQQPSPEATTQANPTIGKFDLAESDIKWERDVFRDVLSNVNQTLRFQIQLAIPLLAGCVTVLNIVPPQSHQELLNELDRWVFIPVIISIAIAYRALEFHWYSVKEHTKLADDIKDLYALVRYKHRMIKWAIMFQALGLILLMVFVLLEYK